MLGAEDNVVALSCGGKGISFSWVTRKGTGRSRGRELSGRRWRVEWVGLGGFDVLGLEAQAYEAGGELLEAGDAGEDLEEQGRLDGAGF